MRTFDVRENVIFSENRIVEIEHGADDVVFEDNRIMSHDAAFDPALSFRCEGNMFYSPMTAWERICYRVRSLRRRIVNWWHGRDGQTLIDGKLYDYRRTSDDEIVLAK